MLVLLGALGVASAGPGLLVGTDVPYQFNLGATYDVGRLRLSVRSGALAGPYSSSTLSILDALGTDDTYIQLLESSYEAGSMNSLGAQLLLGRQKRWQLGVELRFDYLFASDTPEELVETLTGESFPSLGGLGDRDITLSLAMYAVGLRFGREFFFGDQRKHSLLVELSGYKHFAIAARLSMNGEYAARLTEPLNALLWEDVFLPYGYLGGLGLNYKYTF